MIRILFVLLLLVINSAVLAAADVVSKPEWYEYLVGLLALPAAVIGIAYSYLLVKKTRLEARKTELEIVEKERAIKTLTETAPETSLDIVRPLVEGRTGQILILRFVLLYVVLQLWGIVESFFTLLVGGTFLGMQQLFSIDFDSMWYLVPVMLLQNIPDMIGWLIIVSIGWPLFKDLNKNLNVDVKSMLIPWRKDK